MKVSVALATYNGAIYLQEQLDSLVNQTMRPDELIVSDDCSSDSTLEILEKFQMNAPFDVKIYQNQNNLGHAGNFENAIKKCTGDIIFFCDQDDYWYTEKILSHVEIYKNDLSVHLILNDARVCNATLDKYFDTLQNVAPIQGEFAHGCCMSFRLIFNEILLPIPLEKYAHDIWANELARELTVRHVCPHILQDYRRHNSTVTTIYQSRSKFVVAIRSAYLTFKIKNIKINPTVASRKRILWLSDIRNRLILKKEYIIANITNANVFDKAIFNLDELIGLNEMRQNTRNLPFIKRFVKATNDYYCGSYSKFSGFNSFIKDVFW